MTALLSASAWSSAAQIQERADFWLPEQISEGRGSKEDNHNSAGLLCFSLFGVDWSVWWPTNRVTVFVAN